MMHEIISIIQKIRRKSWHRIWVLCLFCTCCERISGMNYSTGGRGYLINCTTNYTHRGTNSRYKLKMPTHSNELQDEKLHTTLHTAIKFGSSLFFPLSWLYKPRQRHFGLEKNKKRRRNISDHKQRTKNPKIEKSENIYRKRLAHFAKRISLFVSISLFFPLFQKFVSVFFPVLSVLALALTAEISDAHVVGVSSFTSSASLGEKIICKI